jgi:hypothetical protein
VTRSELVPPEAPLEAVRRVHHAQALEAVDAQLRIDDRRGVLAHPAERYFTKLPAALTAYQVPPNCLAPM